MVIDGRNLLVVLTRLFAVAGVLALLAPTELAAQSVTLDLGSPEGPALSTRTIQLLALMTVLSIVPGLAIMITCFPFIVTVLSILRQAIGLQQAPPNMLIISLSLFLTWFVMEPVFLAAWAQGGAPLSDGSLEITEAIPKVLAPFQVFMSARIDPETFAQIAALRPGASLTLSQDTPLSILIPTFLLSEIARAFEIGFLIFLPFLIIDLVVSAVLMSMGMMMLPPAVVALPFKLAFFAIADGWTLISSALVRGYM